jgi:hypothetical protein
LTPDDERRADKHNALHPLSVSERAMTRHAGILESRAVYGAEHCARFGR